MRQWFKRRVWGLYTWEYDFIREGQEPSPQTSLCRLSCSLVGLSIVTLVIFVLGAVTLLVAALLAAPIMWFLGFSPNYRKWIFAFEGVSFLQSEGSYSHKTHYKLNKRFAPWEIVVPLVLVAVVAFGIQQGFVARLFWAVQGEMLIVGIGIGITVAIIAFFVALVLSIPRIVRNISCPVPLDFSDIVEE